MSDSIALLKWRACRAIDTAAADARLRHITDIPMQEVTYYVKWQEAKSYMAAVALNAQADVPPHIAAEAARIWRTPTSLQTPAALAATVKSNGDIWFEVTSPTLESERVGAKADVMAANSEAEIEGALAAGIAALAGAT